MNTSNKIKKGYLDTNFKFFHLKDKKDMSFDFHYHDFNKIVIFISGDVTYLIEGKSYNLKPWDLLFICSNDLHSVEIKSGKTYERIIIWVNSQFLKILNNNDNLLTCFELSLKKDLSLLRLKDDYIDRVKELLFSLENAVCDMDFGNDTLKNAIFLELMVYLNRLSIGNNAINTKNDIIYNEQIAGVIKYINEHLSESLSIDALSSEFFINKYYLMHKFKESTGYTLHNYILHKRLLLSKDLIKQGAPITEVYLDCGFGDYSNFIRNFKRFFGVSPKKYYKTI